MEDLLAQLIWVALSAVVGGVVGHWAWYKFFQRKEQRLFRNIQRPIALFGTTDIPLNHEATLLDRVGFFDVGEPTSDSRATHLFNGKRLVIIGYTPNSSEFRQAFTAATQRELPVIVYAGPTRITDADMNLLQSYPHHSMCNTPLRLISDVFALMSTYPEDK